MSSDYIVSARKYRPATFKTVVGQKTLTATLKNAIASDRLAQAYLFCGPRGVGKTSCARIFAKTINCLSPTADGEACGECESCRAIDRGTSFNIIELDAASNNSVDDIRNLTEQVNVPPQSGRYRVFIIDEVHMLSSSAFNAFLKTLEEPPKYVIFILATTEKHKVIPTILSRCQIYDFKRITVADMIDHLEYVASEEGITAEREGLAVIASKADGAMRDALSIFDQVAASSMGHITYRSAIDNLNVLDHDYYFRILDAAREGDIPAALLVYKEVRDKGFDSLFFLNGLANHVRDLMVAADPRTLPLLETTDEIATRFSAQAASLPVEWYYEALKIINDSDFNYRTATDKRLLVELTLIRLCQLLNPPHPPFDHKGGNPPLRDIAPRPHTADTSAAAAPAPASASRPEPAVAAPTNPPRTQPSGRPTASATPATHDSPAPPRPSSRPATRRLSDIGSRAADAPAERRNNPVTQTAFAEAWNMFIAHNPALHILTNAMRGARISQTSPTSFGITVDHPAQQQAFASAMPKLVAYLRDNLANDYLTLSVEIDTSADTHRKLPPQEFLKKVVAENPAVAEFLRNTDAELA